MCTSNKLTGKQAGRNLNYPRDVSIGQREMCCEHVHQTSGSRNVKHIKLNSANDAVPQCAWRRGGREGEDRRGNAKKNGLNTNERNETKRNKKQSEQ